MRQDQFFLAAQGLQPFFGAQGLQLFAAQGLQPLAAQGLHPFATLQGLQAPQVFLAPQPATRTRPLSDFASAVGFSRPVLCLAVACIAAKLAAAAIDAPKTAGMKVPERNFIL
jgi:hypothetical protein